MVSVLFLQPPSPPGMNVSRDCAGGFGIAKSSSRNRYGHWEWCTPYVSLMYSAGVLTSEDYDIAYIDAQAERLDDLSTIARISQLKPKIIVSVINLPSVEGDADFHRRLKGAIPDATLVCLGTICRVITEELAEMDFADILILDEAEIVLPNLVRTLTDNGEAEDVEGLTLVRDGKSTKTPRSARMADLASLPWPPYDIMPTTAYRDMAFGPNVNCLPIWASRGCPMPCSFYCPYPVGLGRKIRLRPTEDFVDEMAFLRQKFGVSAFVFRDQIFSSDSSRAEEICDLLIERRLGIQWICETRFDKVNRELLRKMSRAGCRRVHYGLETGDPDLLHRIGKRGVDLSMVKEAIRLTRESGITPLTHIIVGLPGETTKTLQNTLKTLRDIGTTRVNVNIATPYPGTPLFKFASERGLIETTKWPLYTSFRSVMRTESLSTDALEEWRDYISHNFLGESFPAKMVSLCRNREIIDYIYTTFPYVLERPSLPFQVFREFLTSRDSNRPEASEPSDT